MNSNTSTLHQLAPQMKPCEGRIASARTVRLMQAIGKAFLYDQERWAGLPARIANAYARFEDKSKHAIRERITM